jgi:hypothetical protein
MSGLVLNKNKNNGRRNRRVYLFELPLQLSLLDPSHIESSYSGGYETFNVTFPRKLNKIRKTQRMILVFTIFGVYCDDKRYIFDCVDKPHLHASICLVDGAAYCGLGKNILKKKATLLAFSVQEVIGINMKSVRDEALILILKEIILPGGLKNLLVSREIVIY